MPNSTLYFTTIFDKNYLSRGLLLYKSLAKYHLDFVLYIVALDNDVYNYFSTKHNHIVVIQIEELENYFKELKQLKKERDSISYIFTLSPFYPLYILKKYPEINHICSLDCDQYFFNSPLPVFNELDNASVLITPHRFTNELIHTGIEKYGKYNVGFQIFKNNSVGLNCLEHWKNQCTNWCKDKIENGLFADQKYLENWIAKFGKEVKEINTIGLGVAPWNINNYSISLKNNVIYMNNEKLILFHYQGLRLLHYNYIYIAFDAYKAIPSKIIIKKILTPIIKGLFNISQQDIIDREKHSFYVDSVPKESTSSYFRLMYGVLITLKQYQQIHLYIDNFNLFLKKIRFSK